MTFWRNRRTRTALGVTLLLGVGVLLGLGTLAHAHDGDFAPSHCEVCRWASDATPALVILLVLLLTLPATASALTQGGTGGVRPGGETPSSKARATLSTASPSPLRSW